MINFEQFHLTQVVVLFGLLLLTACGPNGNFDDSVPPTDENPNIPAVNPDPRENPPTTDTPEPKSKTTGLESTSKVNSETKNYSVTVNLITTGISVGYLESKSSNYSLQPVL